MAKKDEVYKDDPKEKRVVRSGSVSSAVYGFGFIGAVIYFVQHATSFGNGAFGILKAIVWPAILVYKALELLKM